MKRIHQFAKHVDLSLAAGPVAYAHGDAVLVARQPGQLDFRQAALATDAVHDLHLIRRACSGTQQPFPERASLIEVTGIHERV